jgi:DNA repair protein RecN (Recombination protein N)
LEQVVARLAQLRKIIRRYGSIENAILRRNELQQSADSEVDTSERLQELEIQLRAEHGLLKKAALALSTRRAAAARQLGEEVTESLASLGMVRARFAVELLQTPAPEVDVLLSDAVEIDGAAWELGDDGLETSEFQIAPNLGEPLKPLAKIASGGEISRVMLAIKSVLAEYDPVVAMVFDEIDAGISGAVGNAVGERMRALAQYRQVVAITHLPQIAARADRHIVVRKEEQAGRTTTHAEAATGSDRITALAALLGGSDTRETGLEHARAMLREVGNIGDDA